MPGWSADSDNAGSPAAGGTDVCPNPHFFTGSRPVFVSAAGPGPAFVPAVGSAPGPHRRRGRRRLAGAAAVKVLRLDQQMPMPISSL